MSIKVQEFYNRRKATIQILGNNFTIVEGRRFYNYARVLQPSKGDDSKIMQEV